MVNFSAAVPDADNTVGYTWDFGTGETEQGSASRAYTFEEAGTYTVKVIAAKGGTSASSSVEIAVAPTAVTPDNQPPVVELSASSISGKAPLPVDFTATATDPDGDALTYSWNFGDAATVAASSEPTQSHTFENAGSYEATVTVSDDRGGIAQASLQIAIADPDSGGGETPDPDPGDNVAPTVILSSNTQEGNAPLTVSFSAEASDPDDNPMTYAWDFGNGQTAEGNSSQTIVYSTPGSYTAKVAVNDGVDTTEQSLTILVNDPTSSGPNTPPSVTISANPTSGKAPLPVAFSSVVSDPDSPTLSYVWDFGDGTISGEASPSHSYTEAGTYTASLTVGDREGGKTRKEIAITVAPGSGDPGTPDVPFYGEWAWAAKNEAGQTFEGYVSISERNPEPLPDNVIEGGLGAWTYCAKGVAACPAPTGVGYIDVVDYGMGDQYDIVFVNNAGSTQLVAFDEDDKLGTEIDGAPTFMGGGAWMNDNGSQDNLTFAMVKISGTPATAMTSALLALSETVGLSQ